MEILIGLAFLVFGGISVLKPEWLDGLERRITALGSGDDPGDIEFGPRYYQLVRLFGILFGAWGAWMLFGQL